MKKSDFIKLPPLHLACGTDELRPALSQILFEGGYAIATNAHILVKIKIVDYFRGEEKEKINLLEGKMIHSSAWKGLLRYRLFEVKENGILAIHNKFTALIEFIKDPEKFPDYKKVLPTGECQPVEKILLNPYFLSTIYEIFNLNIALGARLEFYGSTKAIKVTNKENNDMAIIMPIME